MMELFKTIEMSRALLPRVDYCDEALKVLLDRAPCQETRLGIQSHTNKFDRGMVSTELNSSR